MMFAIAILAIETKNHTLLNGKMMRVMWSRRDPDARKSTIGNLFVKVSGRQSFRLKIEIVKTLFGSWLFLKGFSLRVSWVLAVHS